MSTFISSYPHKLSHFSWRGSVVGFGLLGIALWFSELSETRAQDAVVAETVESGAAVDASTLPSSQELIASTPRILIESESKESISFVAYLPTAALIPLRFDVSVIEGVQAIRASSVQGAPFLGTKDGQGYFYDCRGPKLIFMDGIYLSLLAEADQERLNFNFGINSSENSRLSFDLPHILSLGTDFEISTLGEHRFQLLGHSPSGETTIHAVYDRSRNPWLESFELRMKGSDIAVFKMTDIRMDDQAVAVQVPLPAQSDLPADLRVSRISKENPLLFGSHILLMIRSAATRVGIEDPAVRSDST